MAHFWLHLNAVWGDCVGIFYRERNLTEETLATWPLLLVEKVGQEKGPKEGCSCHERKINYRLISRIRAQT